MEQFLTRQATIQDLDDLVELFNEYRIFYEQESDKKGARQFLWEKFEHNESVIIITLEEETKVAVGFTQLFPSFSSVSMKRIWILNDLYVREQFRGNQIGRKLLEAAREYAILTKAKRIELTTARTNLKAQGLYEMNGYEVDEIFYNYTLTV